eukprot:716622-Rhodomonas_salina.1
MAQLAVPGPVLVLLREIRNSGGPAGTRSSGPLKCVHGGHGGCEHPGLRQCRGCTQLQQYPGTVVNCYPSQTRGL